MKTLTRKIGIEVMKACASRFTGDRSRAWVCDRAAPWLMDRRALPDDLVERPLRNFDVQVLCNPYIYTHRAPYWCGHLFEIGLERYLARELRPGDTFIDVGCNVGQVSMVAASLVGQSGCVHAFDANPRLAALTSDAARRHRFEHVKVHAIGLGDANGEFDLQIDPQHDGGGTLRSLEDDVTIDARAFTQRVRCRVEVGDRVLADTRLRGRVGVKIDVEGHEPAVVRGLERTLRDRVDHAIVEVSPAWIGGSEGVASLFAMFETAGFRPYELLDSGSVGPAVSTSDVVEQANIVFRR